MNKVDDKQYRIFLVLLLLNLALYIFLTPQSCSFLYLLLFPPLGIFFLAMLVGSPVILIMTLVKLFRLVGSRKPIPAIYWWVTALAGLSTATPWLLQIARQLGWIVSTSGGC